MKKSFLITAMLVATTSLLNSVNAELVECNCECHKTKPANAIEIGYPAKQPANAVEIPVTKPVAKYMSSSSDSYSQSNGSTTNSASSQTSNSSGKKYEGSVEKTPVHFGNNISDTEGNHVVNAIGRKLVKAAGIDKNVYFTYSTEATVNAQTEFNGTITVFKGIMGCCENEDELAFVIGHELGHADGYHVAKATAVNMGLNYGANEAAKALNKNISSKINKFGLEQGSWSNLAVNKAQELGNATYSKAHENDADLNAVDYLVKCGYNPLAGISVLNKLDGAYPDLFADHPSTDKRIQNIYNYVKQKYPQYISKGYNTNSYNQAIETYVK